MTGIIGKWWNDRNIALARIGSDVYALNGWNGERYNDCWKCTGDHYMVASKEKYSIEPIYKRNGDDDYEIESYRLI
jgi:hypothetical protein